MISGYFGLPGSGKSSFLAMIAQRELKKIDKGKSKYCRVLTNFACHGCYRLNFRELGMYEIKDSLLLIDEITLEADSRDFKNFNQRLKEFFIKHRHMGNDIIYFTQQWDGVDKKIRDLTQELWHVTKKGQFTKATLIYRILDINEEKQIIQGYRFPNWLEKLLAILLPFSCRVHRWCYRPLYYKYFDSFECSPLPVVKFEKW